MTDDQTAWQDLHTEVAKFARHWGLRQSALRKDWGEGRIYIDLKIGNIEQGFGSLAEARAWFRGFSAAYQSAVDRARAALRDIGP